MAPLYLCQYFASQVQKKLKECGEGLLKTWSGHPVIRSFSVSSLLTLVNALLTNGCGEKRADNAITRVANHVLCDWELRRS